MVGFMGCFAAVNALKLAEQIVRADPAARVLVVNLELCSLHLQEDLQDVPKMLSFLLFGDGASAALVTAEPHGIALGEFARRSSRAAQELITWHIGDSGFRHAPFRPGARAASAAGCRSTGRRCWPTAAPDAAAVGGPCRRPIDPRCGAAALGLPPEALRHSRDVLREFGNMSSATLMFVLERFLGDTDARGAGIGMAFGPGLTVETFAFHRP